MLSAAPDIIEYQREFMEVQIHRIEVDKWCQGERQHSDPGDDFIIDWVYKNAKKFRDEWQKSVCQYCVKHRDCGYLALSACDNFEKMEWN